MSYVYAGFSRFLLLKVYFYDEQLELAGLQIDGNRLSVAKGS